MFQAYTEKARRVIFFARYEASVYGSPCIETEHLLLGFLRENKAQIDSFSASATAETNRETIRKEIESRVTMRERISTSVEVPLSNDSKRVLHLAVEEAEYLGHRYVSTEHLLLGLMAVETGMAAELLKARGVRADEVRERIRNIETYKTRQTHRSAKSARLSVLRTMLSSSCRDSWKSFARE